MENQKDQKVRDLSTAQSPKATDFVMLITNLTNNVLEKCQISALREVLTTNSISDDEGNALTTGSDDKLYVEDLTETIGIVQSNLTNYEQETDLALSNLDANKLNIDLSNVTSAFKNGIINYSMPDYANEINVTTPYLANPYTIPKDGVYFISACRDNGELRLNINGVVTGLSLGEQGVGGSTFPTLYVPLAKNDVIYFCKLDGTPLVFSSVRSSVFYPFKGGVE